MSVYVIGSFNRDQFFDVARFPQPGETITGHLRSGAGGKGFNQAVAAARASRGTVSFIGAVGADEGASFLRARAAQEKVDLRFLRESQTGASTGTAFIMVDQKGENLIVIDAGANAEVSVEQLAGFSFQGGDVLVAQLEIPLATIEAAFRKARAENAITVLNAAPMRALPDSLLSLADILVVNETECAALAGKSVQGTGPEGFAEIAQSLAKPDQMVLVTLGGDGVLAVQKGKVYRQAGLKNVKVVDTTGAGDCFVGYFCASLDQGCALEVSLARANQAAGLSVTRSGASESVPTLEEVEAALAVCA